MKHESRWMGARLIAAAAMTAGLFFPVGASAQVVNVRDVLLDMVYRGIRLAPTGGQIEHAAHFTSGSTEQFLALRELNTEIGRQTSWVRLASSAGGFAYRFDPTVGVYSRATETFGPIYAERALTIGKGKYNLGLSFTSFGFDKFDDLQLRDGDVHLVFAHVQGTPGNPDFQMDLVTARAFIGINSDVASLGATYGVTDGIDLSLAIPMVSVEFKTTADLHVERLFTSDQPEIHRFPNGTDSQTYAARGKASGLGDVMVRGKFKFAETTFALLAATTDFRMPTGEERNLLGTGAYQAVASLLASGYNPKVSPHGAVGYALSEGAAPEEIQFNVGLDWAVDSKLTIAADLLGRTIDGVTKVRVEDAPFPAAGGQTVFFPVLRAESDQSVSVLQGSLGAKINVTGNLLFTANFLFSLSDTGLRDEVSPLLGLDYNF